MSKCKIPYIHIYIYKKLKEKVNGAPYIKTSLVISVLKSVARVPKIMDYPILKQMEENKLIKRKNHEKYEILESDYESELNKLRSSIFWDD